MGRQPYIQPVFIESFYVLGTILGGTGDLAGNRQSSSCPQGVNILGSTSSIELCVFLKIFYNFFLSSMVITIYVAIWALECG